MSTKSQYIWQNKPYHKKNRNSYINTYNRHTVCNMTQNDNVKTAD